MIYILKKHNYDAYDAYARITHSKKACFNYFIACFNYFIKLKQDNISELCVYNDEWKLERVVSGYYNIYEFLKR
jgi:hypothetical protein